MIGNRLKELREGLNLLQKELADKLNLTQQTISLYESNKREPDFEIVEKIADFFDVSVDYLLGRTQQRKLYDIETIAAHHDGDDWTDEELADIEKFKEFVKMRREQKRDK